MSLTWRSNNGSTWVLDGSSGVTTVEEDQGIFTIPTDLVIDQNVGDGGVLVQQRKSPRRVMLSFMLDDDGGSVLTLWRTFFVALAAGGTLTYAGPDGDRTLTNVVLEGPDQSLTGQDLQFHGVDRYVVSLLALDPWWYGPTQTEAGTFGAPTPWNDATTTWDAAIPRNGGSSASITNIGDAPASCVVVVTGAASSASMSVNGRGGWTIDATIDSGEYLSVSSVPGAKGPHRGSHGVFAGTDGPVDWSLLTESSQLFELPVGESSLVFGVSGDDGSTGWLVQWASRFLTP